LGKLSDTGVAAGASAEYAFKAKAAMTANKVNFRNALFMLIQYLLFDFIDRAPARYTLP
jgi:hypothetical protein